MHHEGSLLAIPETEQWVLGLIMSHGHIATKAAARLDADHFTLSGSRPVWEAIKERVGKGKNVSIPAVYGDVRKDKRSREFMERMMGSPTEGWRAAHFDDLCEQLDMARTRRKMSLLGQEIMKLAQGDFPDPTSLEVMVQAETWNATQHVGGKDVVPLTDAAKSVVDGWQRQVEGREVPTVSVGFRNSLNHKLGGGLAQGDLYVLAGRPHMGKTALAVTLALNVAKGGERRVLYFSPEMDAQALATRALQSFGGIATEDVLDPSEETVGKGREVLQHLQQAKIDIVPDRAPTVDDIVAKARAYKLEHQALDLIVIDHLGEIRLPRSNRNQATLVGEVVQRIRAMAGDLHVPVLLLSQLNRSLEGRDNKRPVNSDLRDSGRIEELADTIMFAYREAVYNEDMPDELRGVAEIIFSKNRRTGRMGPELIEFVPQFVRFQEAERNTLRHYAEYLDSLNAKEAQRSSFGRRSA